MSPKIGRGDTFRNELGFYYGGGRVFMDENVCDGCLGQGLVDTQCEHCDGTGILAATCPKCGGEGYKVEGKKEGVA